VLEVARVDTGAATLHVEAKGYRAAHLEVAIRAETPEVAVRLQRGKPLSGKVINAQGQPIVGARILGGFVDEYDPQNFYETRTDAQGRFEFNASVNTTSPFYAIAAGYALTVVTLRDDEVATVVLHPPSPGAISLRDANTAPENVYLVMVAPSGGEFVPLGVLAQLANLNGMDLYQLCGSAVDGDVILPQFIAPGSYDVFLARRGGKPFLYQRIGTITTPLKGNKVLTIASGK
jgi:hypothetical protein